MSEPRNEPRKGARSLREIPQEVLQKLNQGQLETANLVEGLAVNQHELMQHLLPVKYHKKVRYALLHLQKQTAMQCIKAIGKSLAEQTSLQDVAPLLQYLSGVVSDIGRAWGAMSVNYLPLNPQEKLALLLPFAQDAHFQVREIAWMAFRETLLKQPTICLPLLTALSTSEHAYLRRFAVEACRPKGVWCKQFLYIQHHPEEALPLLVNLKADSSRYVQNSVANWLNDLSKTQPQWVVELCRSWTSCSSTPSETTYIVNRALRTLRKKNSQAD